VSAHTHLAGVIPVANLKSDFELDTPPFLLPIAPAFTAIQKSIFECAMAGCQTIWIAANDDVAPILRKHIGEWVFDPVHYKRDLTKFYMTLTMQNTSHTQQTTRKNLACHDL